MKKVFPILFCVMLSTETLLSQKINQSNLIGTWQFQTSKVGSALKKHFRFYKNGNYILAFDEYNDNNRIVSIEGKYKIQNDSLYLTVIKRFEKIGGELVQGSLGIQENEFVFSNSKIKEFKNKQIEDWLNFDEISIEKNKKGENILTIVANKYFQISKNANFYKK